MDWEDPRLGPRPPEGPSFVLTSEGHETCYPGGVIGRVETSVAIAVVFSASLFCVAKLRPVHHDFMGSPTREIDPSRRSLPDLTLDEEPTPASTRAATGTRWRIPESMAQVVSNIRVPYQFPESNACSAWGLRPSAVAVRDTVLREFPDQLMGVEGFVCRHGAKHGQISLHGAGRALDLFPGGDAETAKARGDKMADWLVAHAEQLHIQLIIWDRSQWRADGSSDVAYHGPATHTDHLHVEVSERAIPTPAERQMVMSSHDPLVLDRINDDPSATPPAL